MANVEEMLKRATLGEIKMSEYSDYYEENGLRTPGGGIPNVSTNDKPKNAMDIFAEYVTVQENMIGCLNGMTRQELIILSNTIRNFKRVVDMHRAYRKDEPL